MSRYFKDEYPLLNSNLCYNGNNWNIEEDVKESERLWDTYQKFIQSKSVIIPKINIYLGSKLHDSWVLNVSNTDKKIDITLNDFSAHCFTDALCNSFKLNVPHKRRKLVINISLENIFEWNLSHLNRIGKILPVSRSRYLPTIHEYLYDELKIVDENNISGAILFTSDSFKNTLLLEFSTKCIKIDEKQEQSFRDLFKEEMMDYWKYYREKKYQGEYFDYSSSIEKLKEMQKNKRCTP